MDRKCYIISYQIISPRDTSTIDEAIKSYGTWAQITETTWAVVTSSSASQVRDSLQTFLSPEDKIFIVRSGFEAAWKNVICTSEWLKKNL